MLLSLCPLAHPMHCLTAWQCEPGHHILSRASFSSVLNYMLIYFVCIHILRHPYRETSGDNFEDLFISSTGSRATWVIKLGAGGSCLPSKTKASMQTWAWDACAGNRGKRTLLSPAFRFRPMKLDVTRVLCDNGNCFYLTHVNFLSQENLPKITLPYAKIGLPILLLQKEQTAMLCQYKVKGLHVDVNNSLTTPLPLLTPTQAANWWISIKARQVFTVDSANTLKNRCCHQVECSAILLWN